LRVAAYTAILIEIDAGKARARAAVVLNADGVCSGYAIIAGIIARLRGRFKCRIVIAVYVIVVTATRGGYGELGVCGRSGVIRFNGNDKVIRRCRMSQRRNGRGKIQQAEQNQGGDDEATRGHSPSLIERCGLVQLATRLALVDCGVGTNLRGKARGKLRENY